MLLENRYRWIFVLLLCAAWFLPIPAPAHPGSGIVIDKHGQIYFVDMVSGVWKLDVHGVLTHIPGPAFHWMALDAGGGFRTTRLPTGPEGDVSRIGTDPTLLLASDFPIVIGLDGNMYYPSHDGRTPVRILKMLPSGKTSIVATLPPTIGENPLRDLNGLARGPDGSLFYTENGAIRRISKEGRITTVTQNVALTSCASIPGIGEGSGPMLRGLDVDSSGSIYVAATGCGSVLKVTPAGEVSIIVQVQSPWAPTGIAVSGNNVYVLEFLGAGSDNRREMIPRIRRITPEGKSSIIATVTRAK